MTAALRTELARLEGEVVAILTAATAEAHDAGLLDPRTSLLACGASRPLQSRISDIRRTLARDEAAPISSAAPLAHVSPVAPRPAPTIAAAPAARINKEPAPMTEEERVATLAELAAALGADNNALAAAVMTSMTPDEFVLALAEKRIEANEAEAIAARIAAA